MNFPQDFSFRKVYVIAALNKFKEEKVALIDYINSVSDAIRDIENNLRDEGINFPFKFTVEKEEEDPSLATVPSNGQFKDLPYSVISYRNKKRWSLGWDKDTESKKFRLLLIEEKAEVVYFFDSVCEKHFEEQLSFKELSRIPFITAKLPVRLKYANFLHSFILAFKDYLKCCYTSMQEDKSIV